MPGLRIDYYYDTNNLIMVFRRDTKNWVRPILPYSAQPRTWIDNIGRTFVDDEGPLVSQHPISKPEYTLEQDFYLGWQMINNPARGREGSHRELPSVLILHEDKAHPGTEKHQCLADQVAHSRAKLGHAVTLVNGELGEREGVRGMLGNRPGPWPA